MASFTERENKKGKVSYYAKIRLKGHRTIVKAFDRKTDAKNWANKTESEIKDGKRFKVLKGRQITLSELVEKYQDEVLIHKGRVMQVDQTTQLNWWRDELGHLALAEITRSDIEEGKNKLFKGDTKPRTPATVNRYLSVLSHAFNVAIKEWEWVDENPVSKVKKLTEPKGRDRFLSPDEKKKLLKACKASTNQFLYPAVFLAIATGARASEVINLKYSDLNLEAGTAALHDTKNKEKRSITIAGVALGLLKDMENNRRMDTEYVFPRADGEKPILIRKAWDKAIKQAKINDFRYHDLRHTAASYLAMNQATMLEIADVLGHKDLQMVKRYAHLSKAHSYDVVKKMNEKFLA